MMSQPSIPEKPSATILIPAYNEASIIVGNLEELVIYLRSLEEKFSWDILIVNDGSRDETGALADTFAKGYKNVNVIHHRTNRNLGVALRTGFKHATGDFVVVLDIDLSYAPDHIERLLDTIMETEADVVIASPYMKGGKNTAVPFVRLRLSKTINTMMRATSGIKVHTFTGMVRAYRNDFLQYLNLKSSTYSINPEIIQKAFILRAKVVEIPAHLDWSAQVAMGNIRTSGIQIYKGILLGLMSSFIFRPYGFFMMIGIILSLLAIYMLGWIGYHVIAIYPELEVTQHFFDDKFSRAVGAVYEERAHLFFVVGVTLILAIQFLALGFISLQKKRYFDELFHLNSHILKKTGSRN